MAANEHQPLEPPSGRSRRPWVVGAVALVAVLAVAGLTLGGTTEPGSPARAPATEAPPIDLPALTGEGRVSLASLRGRPVVVNLFASWCAPCRKELPAFREVSEELENKVAFLGVNHQDTRKGGQDMVAEFGIGYPAGYDPDGRVALDYALIGMPSTLFVSADGRLLKTHTGELNRQQLEETISRLFGVV